LPRSQILGAAVDGWALRRLLLAAALLLLAGAAAGLGPLALKTLVDRATHPGRLDSALWLSCAAYVGALAAQRLCEAGQAWAYGLGEQRVVRRLASQSLDHLLRLPMADLRDMPSGRLAQSLQDGLVGFRLLCGQLIQVVLPVLVQLLFAVGVLAATLSPVAAVAFLAAAAACGAAFHAFARRLARSGQAVSAAQVRASGLAQDALQNSELVKAFTAEANAVARFDGAWAVLEDRWRGYVRRRWEIGLVTVAMIAGMTAAAVGLGAALAVRGRLTIGGLVLVLTYVLQLIRPLELAGAALRDIGQGLAFLQTLVSLRQSPAEADAPGCEDVAPETGTGGLELVLEGVSCSPSPGLAALIDISFRAAAGSVIAIVGPSGSGKTTLLRLLLRLQAPSAGRIVLDGRPLESWPIAVLRRLVTLAPQDTGLLDDSLGANIALGRPVADAAEVSAAIAASGLAALVARLPEGLGAGVGERGQKLSGGERQRVGLARAVLRRARLVLLDESTSALDPALERSIWPGLRGLAPAATVVLVTHRLSLARGADEILVLDAGRLVERGRHEALLADGGLYAQLWRDQVLGSEALGR
jgi:ATP-binding cassette subfamily B protein